MDVIEKRLQQLKDMGFDESQIKKIHKYVDDMPIHVNASNIHIRLVDGIVVVDDFKPDNTGMPDKFISNSIIGNPTRNNSMVLGGNECPTFQSVDDILKFQYNEILGGRHPVILECFKKGN